LTKLRDFIKNEPVLDISFICALASCFFVPPDAGYAGYIDLRTLALLYCLMVTVAGLGKAGIFAWTAHKLCVHAPDSRAVGAALVLLCFFSSMFITNDVALLTFVPFAAVVLGMSGQTEELIIVAVMQTAAANLGSMLLPVGNPQNIYLYSYYHMTAGEFFSAAAPVCAVSLALLALGCLALPKRPIGVDFGESPDYDGRELIISLALLALCLASVFRAMEWYVLLPAVIVILAVFDRKLMLKADFPLLLTFVCFFVFAGNLGRTDAVERAVKSAIGGREMIAGAAVSQVISNVPAAVLLSGFTGDGRALLLGTDIGGLGTPVASLASLISLRIYSKTDGARQGRYLAVFSAVNFSLLALLLVFAELIM
jgi:Na+/H+ antiporter NhaD/arsenite permease-like protein